MADPPSVANKVNDSETRPSSRALPGLVLACHFDSKGLAEELNADQSRLEYQDGWLWLHFDLSIQGASQSLESISSVPTPAKTLLKAKNEQQQLYVDDACAYGVLANLIEGLDGTTGDIDFIQFAMTDQLFISSTWVRVRTFDSLRDIVRNRRISSPAELLKVVIENVLNSVEQYAGKLAKDLDDIEETVLDDQAGNERQLVGQIRRDAVRLHRQIAVGRSLIHRIERNNIRNAKLSLRSAMEGLAQRLDWLNTEIDALRERAHLLQEEAMLKTADQNNSHLQVLAIVATVFLPATLIAGIFGMNVKGLPLTENGNGFLWSMAVLVGASALIFWLLKWSGMLGK
jgi:zinc transporter